MSKLLKALNAETVTTENGAKAYASTLSKVLDFFYLAPASRTADLTGALTSALNENTDLTVRALLWLRDAREGAGERNTFRKLVTYLAFNHTDLAAKLLGKIPELGRFDDLMLFWGTPLEDKAVVLWLSHMADYNALAFKWAPRKDKKGAKPLRTPLGYTEQEWRKFVVSNSDTVEQKMCAKEFDSINFEHVPSVAMARYTKSFAKNATTFSLYKEALESGDAKVNAGAIFPHDVVKSCANGDSTVASKQWEALPNYFEESKYKNILSVVDVSYSMNCPVSGGSTAMDVAVALGLYCSEHSGGHFKDTFMTFSERPELQVLSGNLHQRINQLKRSKWGYNTDLSKVFDVILKAGIAHNVPQSEMPDVVLIPSDMQFDQACTSSHFLPQLEFKYAKAGYEIPKLVFWQVNAREGGIPVTVDDKGTAIISGFSPSILKSVLSGEIDPEQVMLRTLNVERYNIA
jgi:hypothetical protein